MNARRILALVLGAALAAGAMTAVRFVMRTAEAGDLLDAMAADPAGETEAAGG